jgi:glycosyltransferase involved in cell wall biosynthesis
VFSIIVVDDASTDETVNLLRDHVLNAVNVDLKVLSLNFNVGHQSAIYQGLLYCDENSFDYVIVMDSDGEDDPNLIPDALGNLDYDITVFSRGRRNESMIFKVCYLIYKSSFKLVTGKSMNYGNYCMFSRRVVSGLVKSSFVHLAAHLSKQKVPFRIVPADRRCRIDGSSKMHLLSLVIHGLYSLAEYAERFLLIFLSLFISLGVLFFLSICYVVYEKLFTTKAILGWASLLSIGFLNGCIMCGGFAMVGLLLLNISEKSKIVKKSTIYKVVR